MATVILQKEGLVTEVKLNRPDLRNAFNEELIVELISVFQKIKKDPTVRVVLLSGEGNIFCAGGDLNWMKSMVGASRKTNEADARRLARLLHLIDTFPKPVIAKVHGAAIGGGVGLMSTCDVILAAEGTIFAMTEVKLGLIPAVISPFVMRRIGPTEARRYFLTGERFDSATALRLGLVHEVVPATDLEVKVKGVVGDLLTAGPEAMRVCKELIQKLSLGFQTSVTRRIEEYTVKTLAALRVTPEAQEGMRAFLEKRKPKWHV